MRMQVKTTTPITILLLLIFSFELTAASEPIPNYSLRTFGTHEPSATLVDWKTPNVLGFQLGSGAQLRVSTSDVLRYGLLRKSRAGQGVLLVDGSFLVGRIVRIDHEACQIRGAFFNVSIPRTIVRSVLFNAPGNAGIETSVLERARGANGVEDQCHLVNGDRLSGTLSAKVDGVLYEPGRVDDITIEFSRTSRSFSVGDLRAIVFSPLLSPLIDLDGKSLTIGLADGSRLVTRSLDYSADKSWDFQLLSGLQIRVRATDLQLSDICYLGVATFSGIERAGVTTLALADSMRLRQSPLFGEPEVISPEKSRNEMPARTLVSVASGWLPHAISLSAGSQAVFKLPVGASRFQTEFAAVSPTPSIHSANVAGGIFLDLSVVRSGGKTETLWRSERRDTTNGIAFVEVDVSGGLAVILSVSREQPTSHTCDGAWIAPLVISSP